MAKYIDLEADTTVGMSITDSPKEDEKEQEGEQ